MNIKILAADIGGTNSRFGVFESGPGGLELRKSQWFKTREADSFSHLIDQVRSGDLPLKPQDADLVVIAIAGPVHAGVRSDPPYIPWAVDISKARDLGFRRAFLINDFVAQAFACRSPAAESARPILPGRPDRTSAIAVIGGGTALGKAALVPDRSGGYAALPSEGGHADFPFVTEAEDRFREFLLNEHGYAYITGNVVISGRGLSSIHRFLTGEDLHPREMAERFAESPETLEWAARFYGRSCRNFALETLARGGLYVAGGVAARSPELLTHTAFEREFRASPTMSKVLADIPVYLMTNEESGLWGAAAYGLQQVRSGMRS